MSELYQEACQPCRDDSPQVPQDEIRSLLEALPGWSILMRDGVAQLERKFEFADFKQALAFTNQVGELAEQEDHHPKLCTEWGSVVVTWWTHKINGLHRNDFLMAARTDRL